MIKYKSVSEFADRYDAFILDIWGVIHDGEAAYPGVLQTMQELKKAGKEIIFLSNAPRRAAKVRAALARFEVTEDLYKAAVSSGEVAYQYFAKRQSAKYLYIGPEKDADLLNGLEYQAVDSADNAEFALATGFNEDNSTLEEKLPQIEAALAAGLKIYCVNPDLLVVRQDGTRMLCAGVIGEYYAKHGGEVEFVGKPYKQTYDYIMKLFSPNIPKSRIAAIGDALATDIKGANSIGVDSILVLGGILEVEKESLEELIGKTGIQPGAILPKFNW